MAIFIPPRRWLRQPYGPLQVDWGNPLSQGLIAALPLGENNVNAVTGRLGAVSSAPEVRPDTRGLIRFFDGSDDQLHFELPQTYSLPLTLMGWYAIDGTSDVFANTAQSDHFASLRNPASIYETASIGIRNYGGGAAGAHGSVLDNTSGTPTGFDGSTNIWNVRDVWQHIAVSFDSTTSMRVFLNGRLDGTGGGAAKDPQVSHLTIGSGFGSTGTSYLAKGRVQNVLAFSRSMSAAEVWEHYSNPWQLYRPLRSRLILFPTGSNADASGSVPIVNVTSPAGEAAGTTGGSLLYPNSVLAMTPAYWVGGFGDVDESPDSPDGNWIKR